MNDFDSGAIKLTKNDIHKYQALHKKYFGDDLPFTDAKQKLSELLRQMELTYFPITKPQLIALLDEAVERLK